MASVSVHDAHIGAATSRPSIDKGHLQMEVSKDTRMMPYYQNIA